MTHHPTRSLLKSRNAVLRPRDSEGRFLPGAAPRLRTHPLPGPDSPDDDTPAAVSPSEIGSQLLEEFRNHVDDTWPQICRSVIGQAIEGDRWALQMVFQSTIGDWRLHFVEPDKESRMHRYLAEISRAMREPDDDDLTDDIDNDSDNGNPYDPAPDVTYCSENEQCRTLPGRLVNHP